jgi:flagellar biosynthesis protein FlhA
MADIPPSNPNPIEKKPLRHTDLVFTFGIFGIVLLLIMPIPAFLIDVLLALSIALSLLTMLIVIYVKDPSEFSIFPTLLLGITLYRLGLNVASTRLILLEGYAGHVIEAFGSFVIRGNYIVGSVVFLILIIINFIVITKGAGRIAEVAARFTLDAMPGKQMAIDAELNAGIVDEATAKKRRLKVQKEADFYGAMDGASKFVRGDAIAGILITFINVLGGIGIGVLQRGMPVMDALQQYSLLSIGDGLVSQIPALVTSVAAGILTTRTGDGGDLSRQFKKQILFYPKALSIAALMMLFFAIVPGLPTAPFLFLGIIFYYVYKSLKNKPLDENGEQFDALLGPKATANTPPLIEKPTPGSIEELKTMIQVDRFSIELGYGLLSLTDPKSGGDILERVLGVRQKFAKDMGLILPPISIRDSVELEAQQYRFLMKNKEIVRATLVPNRYLAMNVNRSEVPLDGLATIEPVFGLEAIWIEEAQKQKAELNGYTVVDASTVLITHLSEVLKENAHFLLEREDTQKLIDTVKEKNPTLVSELLPDLVSVGIIQRVLQNLLVERIGIKNLSLVLETIADYAPLTKNPDDLSEQVRRRLGSFFMSQYEAEPGVIKAITLDTKLEQELVSRVKRSHFEVSLIIDPPLTLSIMESLSPKLNHLIEQNLEPILITTADLRLAFKRFFEPNFPRMHVLAYQELPKHMHIQSLGILRVALTDGADLKPAML